MAKDKLIPKKKPKEKPEEKLETRIDFQWVGEEQQAALNALCRIINHYDQIIPLLVDMAQPQKMNLPENTTVRELSDRWSVRSGTIKMSLTPKE